MGRFWSSSTLCLENPNDLKVFLGIMLVLEPKKTSQMYSRNSTNTAQNGFVLSFALDSFMFPHSPKVAIEPFDQLYALPSFMFPTSPKVAIGPHRMASCPINHLSSCPIGRLSGWPGCRGWLVGQPRHPMPWLVGWLASWSGWPLVGWMAVGWLAGWLDAVVGWLSNHGIQCRG